VLGFQARDLIFKKTYLAAVTNNRVRGLTRAPSRDRVIGQEIQLR